MIWIIKCRKCGSFEVLRYYDVVISCLDCGCVFVLGKAMIYDPEMEVKNVINNKGNRKERSKAILEGF